ncbi:MAG: DUF262 domain-containing protein [Methylobacter sp.]|nr:DUF262 domain-containing protein [Methylobacter sp.]
MKKWNSSPHPISDIRDWFENERLILRPDYQRKEVWSPAARVMLIDTILGNIPMPKIFVSNIIKEERTYRTVIDGQQRISAILGFLRNDFCLKLPYEGEYKNTFFKDLPLSIKDEFFAYSIDFNEFKGFSDIELREIYLRVNKYTVSLNKQELRRADFHGSKFLDLSEKLALESYWSNTKIFSLANLRRLGDVEYISELLAGLINSAQDKKQTLDDYYQNYAQWDSSDLNAVKQRFLFILDDIEKLFSNNTKGIAETRFRQKSDFYSLFLAIDSIHKDGYSLNGKDLSYLQEDLKSLDNNIAPHSIVGPLREYATRCLSDANSRSSRLWRQNFIKKILSGTYKSIPPVVNEDEHSFASISLDLDFVASGGGLFGCPSGVYTCSVCDHEIEDASLEELILVWPVGTTAFQISNSEWIHAKCYQEDSDYFIERSINSNQQDLFKNTDDEEQL